MCERVGAEATAEGGKDIQATTRSSCDFYMLCSSCPGALRLRLAKLKGQRRLAPERTLTRRNSGKIEAQMGLLVRRNRKKLRRGRGRRRRRGKGRTMVLVIAPKGRM